MLNGFSPELLCDERDVSVKNNDSRSDERVFYDFPDFSSRESVDHYVRALQFPLLRFLSPSTPMLR